MSSCQTTEGNGGVGKTWVNIKMTKSGMEVITETLEVLKGFPGVKPIHSGGGRGRQMNEGALLKVFYRTG